MRESLRVAAQERELGQVIIFHGVTSSPLEVKPLAEYLSKSGFSSLCPLLPGHERGIEELARCPSHLWLKMVQEVVEQAPDGVIVIGVSLGALLALHAAELSSKVRRTVAISPPLKFRSSKRELWLPLLATLPDFLLNMLWTVPKVKRPGNTFSFDREAFDRHSLAAAARLCQVRQQVLANRGRIKGELLIAYDPEDHHLKLDGEVSPLFPDAKIISLSGAQHEMVIGPMYRQVYDEVLGFINS